ncbi:MAG TPA: hypothetical protein VF070_38745 [Streptosporangiaceae bacterium]
MTNRTTKRIRLLSAVSVLAQACGVLAVNAAPAGAATTPAHVTSMPARTAAAPPAVGGPAHLAVNRPVNSSIKATCSPKDLPYRFSNGTWTTYWLEKSPNGCQSVWVTSGQTFNYEVIDVNGTVVASGTCHAGLCQLWNPAANYDPFYIWDSSDTTTSVNIYY